MQEEANNLEPHLQRLVDANVSGIEIMHGQLKLDLLQAQTEYSDLYEEEEANDFSDAMESMERKYAEGFMDAIMYCYKLTYDISFAEGIRAANKADGHI